MLDLCRLIFRMASDLLRSRVALEAEIPVLRQQINVLRRANPKRLRFASIDRLILGGVCRLFPKMYGAPTLNDQAVCLASKRPYYGALCFSPNELSQRVAFERSGLGCWILAQNPSQRLSQVH
jgi:hypothetical protein